jgi:cytochrome c2
METLKNRRLILISVSMLSIFTLIFTLGACVTNQKIAVKSGAQLWAENCQHCHNTPPPNTFSPEQWETIGMHMETRALITHAERVKIVDFLKQAAN